MKQILVLLLVVMSATAFAQSSATVKEAQPLASKTSTEYPRLIGGVVTDESNHRLPGVNVLVLGTTIGTTTNDLGTYLILVPEGDQVLLFSFIGYLSVAVFVGQSSIIDVKMNPDAVLTLDERMKK